MFESDSRYAELETTRRQLADGRTVSYTRRRFLPRGETLPTLVEVTTEEGERVDQIAHRTLGDPDAAWQICDAMSSMNPADLTARPGTRLRVPLPQVIDGGRTA